MISRDTEQLLEKVSVLRAGLAMDVIRIRQSDHSPRIYALPVRDLGMRLHDLGQELMDHADRLDSAPDYPSFSPIPELDR